MNTIHKRGFTIVEILVIIAIIGILSAEILAATSGSRSAGSDAAVKSNLINLQKQAEVDYYASNNYCYIYPNTTLCSTYPKMATANVCPTSETAESTVFADPVIQNQLAAAKNAGGKLSPACHQQSGLSNGIPFSRYAVAVQMKSDPTKAWCVDSTGASKLVTIGGSQFPADLYATLQAAKCN